MAHKLIFRGPEHREERRLEGTSVRVGRDPGNDVAIEAADWSVSRFHARFEYDGKQWRVVDTMSTNRVRVNDELIVPGDAGAHPLTDGDRVLLGGFEIRFVREESDKLVFEEDKRTGTNATLSFTPMPRVQDLSSLIEAPLAGRMNRETEEAIERAKRALGVLAKVGRRIAAVTPADDIIDAIVELVFEATPAERTALFLCDEDGVGLVPKCLRTRVRAATPTTMSVSETLVRRAFTEKAVVEMDPNIALSDSMHRLKLQSAVAVPLLADSKAVGAIYADSSTIAGAFDPFAIALLSALASHAAIALEQAHLLRQARQEERKRARLEQYLAPGVVTRILASGESTPGGFSMKAEEVEVTVVFCDMAGFTSQTEDMAPHEVLLLLNRCFSHMAEVVQEHGGTVDKYIGDCLMAVFGAPFPQADHASRAAFAALAIRDVVQMINNEGAAFEVDFRIGMHSGRAVAGDVGHVARRNWTVLGSTVNLASRIESSVAKPGQIVMTGATRAALGEEFEVAPIEVQKPPKGISRGFQAFELIGLRGTIAPAKGGVEA
jgi:adenylate cyclase